MWPLAPPGNTGCNCETHTAAVWGYPRCVGDGTLARPPLGLRGFTASTTQIQRLRYDMILLGVILLVIGLVAGISILWTIGVILVVVGAILWILGAVGHAVGGRRHYW